MKYAQIIEEITSTYKKNTIERKFDKLFEDN